MANDGSDTEPGSASFGDTRVDGVLDRLEGLTDLPVEDHPEVYNAIHARLRAMLTGLDEDDVDVDVDVDDGSA